MNTNRLIRMAINMLMRRGIKHLSKGQKPNPATKQAQQSIRTINKIRRM